LLHQLGEVLYQQDQFAQARQVLEESLQINTDLGDQEATAGTLHQLSWVMAQEGHLDEARSLCQQCISILEGTGSPYREMAQESLAVFDGKR
jgi:Tfp pilus assembly protein PilF